MPGPWKCPDRRRHFRRRLQWSTLAESQSWPSDAACHPESRSCTSPRRGSHFPKQTASLRFGERLNQHPGGRGIGIVPGQRQITIGDDELKSGVVASNRTGYQQLVLGNGQGIEQVERACDHVVYAALLRPHSWLSENRIVAGSAIPFSVPELGVEGRACVLAIEPCPPIESGRGRVITGTFRTTNCRVLQVHLAGEEQPLEPTPPQTN